VSNPGDTRRPVTEDQSVASINVRTLRHADTATIPPAFSALGWPGKTAELYERYLADQTTGDRLVFVAETDVGTGGNPLSCASPSSTPRSASPSAASPSAASMTTISSTAVLPSTVPPSTVSSTAVPPSTVPPSTVSSTAVSSTAVPPSTVSSTAVPSTAVPSTAVPSTAVPPTAVPPTAVPPTAARAGVFAGYVTVVWVSGYRPFAEAGIPEIQDLNVLPQFRRRGIASALMDAAEAAIAARAVTAGIGVGLYADYGAAQLMYLRRGYLPDGRGIAYRGATVAPATRVPVNDDLVLMLTRRLHAPGAGA
jgi:ribosomal protein S18 acetylase RimI-like enzyme